MLTAETLAREDERSLNDLRSLICSYASGVPVTTLAVVGNAPLEPSVERAAEIDSSDVVIRCNSLVLDEPGEACSGSAVHVVVLNSGARISPWMLSHYSDRLYLRSQPGAIYRRRASVPLPKVQLWPDDLGVMALPNRGLITELRAAIKQQPGSLEVVDAVVPTSGIVAAWIAYKLFPEATVKLTGFSALVAKGRPDHWRHHWDSGVGPVPVSQAHLVDREGSLMRQWVAEGRALHLA